MSAEQSNNQHLYNEPDIVNEYTHLGVLQAPEMTILREFDDKWCNIRLLDIGVGAGRTTLHFAPRVKDYVGVDYAAEMIKACEKRFDPEVGRLSFAVCDARDMRMFATGSFDFVFFSFNGIDYVSHEDRLRILDEVRRVVRKGGHFFFSTHNLKFAPNIFNFNLRWPPLDILRRIKKVRKIRGLNLGYRNLLNQPHAFLNDGVHNFRLQTYYIQPNEQIAQLTNIGFSNTKIYSITSGEELTDISDPRILQEPWLYYLSTI
jgi:ubiquinone/menaquinone biosynthesis C-methylase UbiE